jgi:hypothetical protein
MKKYKLRTECTVDVINFLNKLIDYSLTSFSLSEGEFEFETDLTLDKIILILQNLTDTHVMYQTVKPIEEYTGERDYKIVVKYL